MVDDETTALGAVTVGGYTARPLRQRGQRCLSLAVPGNTQRKELMADMSLARLTRRAWLSAGILAASGLLLGGPGIPEAAAAGGASATLHPQDSHHGHPPPGHPSEGALPRTVTVLTGSMSDDRAIMLLAFMPSTLIINVGDTVRWVVGGNETHTVTFIKPGEPWPDPEEGPFLPSGGRYDGLQAGGSGELNPGDSYSLTFTRPGDYPYVCFFHSSPTNELQRGLIRVQPAGSLRSSQPADINLQARRQLLQQGRHLQASLLHQALRRPKTIFVGVDDGRGVAVLRFLPHRLVIQTGETVTFQLIGSEPGRLPAVPHTVTFGERPTDLRPLIFPSGDPNNYQGGSLNSGFLWALPPAGFPILPPVTTFSVRFTQPGRYPFFCSLHAEAGMEGVIIVKPRLS